MDKKKYYELKCPVYVKDPDTIIAQGMEFTKVVRCGECECMEHQHGGGYFCSKFYVSTEPSWFCSWAVRKDA